MADKAVPTITLAELYEGQNQYVDALVIYKNLYKENPNEELQNKIDELKEIIFKENTLEYASITDKLFTDEEKRLFQILPHEQYKAYKDSITELDNQETFPEELSEIPDEEPVVTEDHEIEDELDEDDSENLLDEENDIDVKPELDNLADNLEIEETGDIDLKESEDQLKPEEDFDGEVTEPNLEEELKEEQQEEQDQADNEPEEELLSSTKIDEDILLSDEEDDDDHILNLLTDLSKMRPDIVERVLKENVENDASLADIKLSDLHYVVELLKVSENVERKE